jgi:raffinose/stachyose/melibiose transport system substrate-binding protein
MTGNYTRRGFLGLSAAAVAAGLAACTGGGTAPAPAGGGGSSAPVSNRLRVFTYEGDETIDLHP